MLRVYRRHRTPRCNQTDRDYRRCSCVLWVDGTLAGKRYHKTLSTRNWETAQKIVQRIEAEGKPPEASKTINDACDSFIRDAEARGLRPPSIYKYRLLFKQLKAFAEHRGISYISDCDTDTLRQFRESWVNKNYSARKKLEALRTFFRFVHDTGWLSKNPSLAIKPPKVDDVPTLPFARAEVEAVLKACDSYPNKLNARRLRALTLLLRHAGLRITDAVTLRKQAISGDGVLTLRTAKTGTEVRVPLPPSAIDALNDVAQPNGYFFWSGRGTKKSCVGDYQRAFKKLYKLAGIANGHAHRWRDTFAVEMLLARVPISDVQALLGHSSIKVTEKHYSPWAVARAEQLESTVRATFKS
jgi:integrase/recombinase XerD